jgi:hypothetical protein
MPFGFMEGGFGGQNDLSRFVTDPGALAVAAGAHNGDGTYYIGANGQHVNTSQFTIPSDPTSPLIAVSLDKFGVAVAATTFGAGDTDAGSFGTQDFFGIWDIGDIAPWSGNPSLWPNFAFPTEGELSATFYGLNEIAFTNVGGGVTTALGETAIQSNTGRMEFFLNDPLAAPNPDFVNSGLENASFGGTAWAQAAAAGNPIVTGADVDHLTTDWMDYPTFTDGIPLFAVDLVSALLDDLPGAFGDPLDELGMPGTATVGIMPGGILAATKDIKVIRGDDLGKNTGMALGNIDPTWGSLASAMAGAGFLKTDSGGIADVYFEYFMDPTGPADLGCPVGAPASCHNFGLSSEGGHQLFTAIVPEPDTFLLLGTGLLGLVAYRRRKAA